MSVSDPIPAGVGIVSVSATAGSASVAGQNVTWSGFNLQAGGSQTMTIRVPTTPTSSQVGTPVVLNPGATATGTRAVDSLPQSASSNVSTGNVSGASLTMTKTAAPLVVQAGATVTYTITLTNSGNAAGAVTSVVDHLPAGFSYASGSTTGTLGAGEPSVSGQDVTWSGAFSVPAAASRTLVFDATAATNPGNASNTADASGTNFTSTSTGSTATVHVNGPPAVNADTASVPEDGQVTVAPLTNDSDPDGDAISVSSITQPSHGTAVLNPDGTVTYTPAPNYNGPDTFNVTVCDTNGACVSSPVNITVVAVNDPPVVNDDTATVNEDGQTTVSPLSNDSDPDGDSLSVSSITQPAHGTTVLNPDRTVTYTPAPDYNGPDSFTVTVCDPSNACGTSTATVTVSPVNDPPVVINDTATVNEDGQTTVSPLSNDSDPDGDPLSVSSITQPSHGTTVLNPDGTVTYTPVPNYNGPDGFTVTVCDPSNSCVTSTVTVTVVAVNDPPVAANDSATTPEDAATTVDVLANDTDVDGNLDPASVSIVSAPSHGTAGVLPDHTVAYTPAPNYHGPDSFTYQVCDSASVCDTATVSMTVTSVNDAPDVRDDATGTQPATPVTIAVLANDSDVDGDALSVFSITQPGHGTAVRNGNGTITYTPAGEFTGPDSFTYTACDPSASCGTATVRVSVPPQGSPPVAVNDSATTPEGTPVGVNVVANDTDPDGNLDPTTLTVLSGPAHGSALGSNGSIAYFPQAAFNGLDSLTYQVCDTTGLCGIATLTITVTNVDQPPVAADDGATTTQGQGVTVDVLGNDTDPDGDTLSVGTVTQPGHGAAAITAGEVRYTPAANWSGTDTFTYQVCDATHLCATAVVVADVAAVNQPPVAADDTASTGEGRPVSVDVLGNDTDPDGRADLVPGSVAVVGDPAHGSVTVSPDGTVTYTPAHGFVGADTFTYRVCDAAATCDTAVVTVQVIRVPAPPVAVDDSGTSRDGKSIDVDVVANDTDPQNSLMPASVKVVQAAGHGAESVHKDGTVTYTPADTFTGKDSFRYQVCNAAKLCSTAVVALQVDRPSMLPVGPQGPDASSTSASTPAVRLGALALTGATLLGTFAAGLLLVVAGAVVTTASRRRRRAGPTR